MEIPVVIEDNSVTMQNLILHIELKLSTFSLDEESVSHLF